jgi:hypothetical protein
MGSFMRYDGPFSYKHGEHLINCFGVDAATEQVRKETCLNLSSFHREIKGRVGKQILFITEALSSLKFNICVFGGVKFCSLVDSYKNFGGNSCKIPRNTGISLWKYTALHLRRPQSELRQYVGHIPTYMVRLFITRWKIHRHLLNSHSSISDSDNGIRKFLASNLRPVANFVER